MDRYPPIKRDPPESSRKPHQDTGETGHIQPLDSTGSRSLTSVKCLVSAGFLDKMTNSGDVSAEVSGTGGDHVRSKAVTKRAGCGGQLAPLEVFERRRTTAAGDPVHLNPTSSGLKDDGSNICFTIPPTEEDLRRMQPSRGKDGHIKRPLNAFMVWSNIHRHALWKTCPKGSMTDTSVLLGSEWSKLNPEQQRPYFEAAQKLKYLHEQQFPDYKFCPKKKMFRECLYSGQAAGQEAAHGAGQVAGQALGQGAGQAAGQAPGEGAAQAAGQAAEHRARQAAGQEAGQNSGVSFIASQTVPPPQPEVFGPSTYPYLVMMPYTLGYHPHPSSCQGQPMGLCSRVKINHSRFFYEYPNASSSTEGVRSDHSSHLQWDEAALTREHHLAHVSHQVTTFTASTTTSGSFEQPGVASGQQLSANYTVPCKYEDEIDVVGLV